jgi:hypothetical protein
MSEAKLKSPKPFVPAAALKRFTEELENNPLSTKFLEINRNRVSDFIEKQYNEEKPKSTISGIYDYSQKTGCNFIHLQNLPEFQKELGFRSRFGEGDGSFFDQWLNGGIANSKHINDKDGLPLMKYINII